MKTKSDIRVVILVVIFALTNISCSRSQYEIIDLGALGATSVQAINDSGQLVGSSGRQAFVYDSKSGLIKIGTLGGFKSGASAINNVGQVVGYAETADGKKHAFLWDKNNGMIDLGLLSGSESYARAVNDSGQVVGSADIDETVTTVPLKNAPDYKVTSFLHHAFIWDSKNGMIDIGTLGGRRSVASAINNSGQVAGWFEDASGEIMHVFFWDSTNGMKDLGPLGDMIEYIGINDTGQVVATAWNTASRNYVSFLWGSNGRIVHLDTLDDDVYVNAINNDGQVAGWSSRKKGLFYSKQAFFWDSDGKITSLGKVGGIGTKLIGESRPSAINNSGQVVGFSGIYDSHDSCHAWLWDRKYGMVKLEDLLVDKSGWKRLISASHINNRGQIVGFGETKDGKDHAFLMTPVLGEN